MAKLTCGGCKNSFDETLLSTKVLTVESCPKCDEVMRKSEGFRYTDAMGIQIQDVAAIESWLNSLDVPNERQIIDKRTIWRIEADRPYRCDVSYDPQGLNLAEVRLSSEDGGDKVTADQRKFQELIGRHGFQPHGKRVSGWNIEQGEFFKITWGAMQLVSTGALCPELFWAIVDRLQAAMDDARSQ